MPHEGCKKEKRIQDGSRFPATGKGSRAGKVSSPEGTNHVYFIHHFVGASVNRGRCCVLPLSMRGRCYVLERCSMADTQKAI